MAQVLTEIEKVDPRQSSDPRGLRACKGSYLLGNCYLLNRAKRPRTTQSELRKVKWFSFPPRKGRHFVLDLKKIQEDVFILVKWLSSRSCK